MYSIILKLMCLVTHEVPLLWFPHYTMSVCCLLFFRVQRKVFSLCVYREGDWLRLEDMRERFDSINTLVMDHVSAAVAIPIGDHEVRAFFRYPVYSSKYYKK